jgi:hypothetical protein
MRAYRITPWTTYMGRSEDRNPRLHPAAHNFFRKPSMTHSLSQRIDAAISTLGMFGLLSPLVLAAVMFVVTSR